MSTGTEIPASSIQGPPVCLGRAPRRGFTMVELLAVIVILGLLIGMIAPSVQVVRRMFLIDQTKAYMQQLTMGIDHYRIDLGELPPSDGSFPHPAELNPSNLSSGAAGLTQCLTGYMIGSKDGQSGPSFRRVRAGRRFGPYVTEKMPYAGDPPVFQDAFGNAILYYRFNTVNRTYNSGDNNVADAKGPSNLMTYIKDVIATDAAHPSYREDYILLSPGPNRVWDQVTTTTTRTDDIGNFTFHVKETQP